MLLLVACGRTTTIDSENVQTDAPSSQDLQQILDRRAQAVLHPSEHEFLADLDSANQRLVDHERLRFANLKQFKFSSFRFILDRVPIAVRKSGQKDTFKFDPVLEGEQLVTDSGPPGVVPSETFEYDVAKRNGRWLVTDMLPGQDADIEPWDLTPLKVINMGNVWLAADDSVSDLGAYASAAHVQAAKVESIWGSRPRFPGYVLFFSRNPGNLRAWFPVLCGLSAGPA
jgi:hypothetical protein